MEFKDYKKVTIQVLKTYIQKYHSAYIDSGNTDVNIAASIKRSIGQVRNCHRGKTELVSHEVFSQFLQIIGIDCFILIRNGEHCYYIKK